MRSNRTTSTPSVGIGRKQGEPAASSVDVFISYSRRDTSFARDLFAFLTERGKDVWADWEDIPPSSVWRADIAAGIEGAGSVVFVVSPGSINSLNCLRELEHAKSCGKRIVPIVCRKVDPDSAPPLLGELNWIFARAGDNREAALAALVEAIDTDLDWVHVHTRLLVRAVEWDANGRNRSFLLRGSDLRAAEQQLASHAATKPVPTPLQTQFVLARRLSQPRWNFGRPSAGDHAAISKSPTSFLSTSAA